MPFLISAGIIVLTAWGILTPSTVIVENYRPSVYVSQVQAAPEPKPDYSTTTLTAYIIESANRNGVNAHELLTTLTCESGLQYNSVGDNGTSFGISQLHNPLRDWGISRNDALNPYLSIDIAAKAFKRGQQSRWTCWRIHFGTGE